MSVRVHTLAKELKLSSKELMDMLRLRHGIDLKNHLSAIEDEVATKLRREARTPVKDAVKSAAAAASTKPSAPAVAAAAPAAPPPAPAAAAPAARKVGTQAGNGAASLPKPPPKPLPKPPPMALKSVLPVRKQPIIIRPKPPEQRPLVRPAPPGSRPPLGDRSSSDRSVRTSFPERVPHPDRPPRPERPAFSPPPRIERRPFGGGGDAPPPTLGRDAGRGVDRGRRRKVRIFPGKDESGLPLERGRRTAHTGKSARKRERQQGVEELTPLVRPAAPADRPAEVAVKLPITLKDLSPVIGVKQNLILATLMKDGILVNVNTHLSDDMLNLISEKFAVKITVSADVQIESAIAEIEARKDAPESLQARAPVVTFLGHVDHGKTSLLDKIRQTRVAAGEAGGITQHMSAYRVDHGKSHVVFIDTPGHRAFTEMRARGANVTDVVVLVVAADDGVMPQTEEAIQHANAATVPIVVALNKIDKPNANPARVKDQLAQIGLAPPEWGGKTEIVEVSARTSQGIDALLELLTLETEILELRSNPDRLAVGTVLDAKNTTGRGIVATVLVQHGTLRKGDPILCGSAWGRVRHLQSTMRQPIDSAGPSTPVEITGLDEVPGAGDKLYAFAAIDTPKEIAAERKRRAREAERAQRTHVTLEKLFDHIAKGKTKEVKLILKADAKGSLLPLEKELQELATPEVGIRILLHAVGEITEEDVFLADASDAIILGFHVIPNERARSLAETKSVEIRTYQVIYEAKDDIQRALEGMLEPELLEESQGMVEIRTLFKSTKLGNIAGCFVRSGIVRRDDPIRLLRNGALIHQGHLSSLKRFKDDAKEVREGLECGLRIQGFDEILEGDIVESYRIVKKARTLASSRVENS
ncbi:MAG: translation initiation factor IF-2 [Planctomycetes bacterium]|nr:translation initiation factor IF-2 [Planctomycetota bacterium]